MLLRGIHVFERETLARLGNVMPIEPFFILELERCTRALFRIERIQERLGRVGHHRRGVHP
jgi:hypothetical protein